MSISGAYAGDQRKAGSHPSHLGAFVCEIGAIVGESGSWIHVVFPSGAQAHYRGRFDYLKHDERTDLVRNEAGEFYTG